MAAKIFYKASVEKDLKRIDSAAAKRILKKFETAMHSPGRKGEALKGEFASMLKFRIGDYRVIYTHIADGILVLRISHRRDSYR